MRTSFSARSFVLLAACTAGLSAWAVACGDDADVAGATLTPDSGTVTLKDAGSAAADAGSDVEVQGPSLPSSTVGGTLTGLAGSGLVLEDANGDVLALGKDGTFTFPTLVKQGTAYSVSVKTQPTAPSQTCTVTNGTGTMGDANVTDVAVTCATDTFAVGGAVTGLDGTLVLTNNGGDDLTVTASGNIVFTTKIASGAAYAVAVKTQPTGQLCTVAHDAGTVGAAAVTDVAVTCAAATSCKQIHQTMPAAASGVYTIKPGNTAYPVYCDMTTGTGGWTLAMKGAATSHALEYAATYWTTTDTLAADQTDLDAEDAKFASFNEVSFSEVMIGTTNANGSGVITVPNPGAAATLLATFQGADFQKTTLGRDAWLASQKGTIVQANCNDEGFNVNAPYVKARIGMQANQEASCDTSDSVVGIGVQANTTCGNTAGPFSAGFHSGPGCTPTETPAVPGVGANFWIWVR